MQTLASLASQDSAVLNEFTQVAFFTQVSGMATAASAAQPMGHPYPSPTEQFS